MLPSGEPVLGSSQPVAADAPARVHVMPLGEWRGADGRGPYRLEASRAAEVARLSIVAAPLPRPIDFDHALDFAAADGRPKPAAGWITGFEAASDGLYAAVEWSERGKQALASKDYRFLSPVFLAGKNGEVGAVLRASLVNNPNFPQLKQLASKGATMDEFLNRLRAALGLAEADDEAKILASVAALAAAPAEIESLRKQLASAGEAGATIATLNTTIAALNNRVVELENAGKQESAAAKVEAAIKAGKLLPALKDWGLALAASDPAAFDKYVAGMPAIVTPGGETLPGGAPVLAGADGLTPGQREVAARLNLKPETFKQAMET